MRRLGYYAVSTVVHIYIAYTQTLPYIPTRLLLSSINSTTLYILQPVSGSSTQSQLLSLDISSTIQASSLSTTVLSSILPFVEDPTTNSAYAATISFSGYINVYAGSCSSAGSVWTWQPSTNGNGTWKQSATSLASSVQDLNSGVNFLSATFSYSPLVAATNAQSTQYIFGGMCPTTSSTNMSTWQAKATYSNKMLKVSSTLSAYTISQSTPSGNIPIIEAGSTLTALTPAYSNSSTGVVTQAQNFVLLGGHTQTAFTNMSQIAIYSLPQENWSYQTISSSTTSTNNELSIKAIAAAQLDSRSGHTAVLSEDGSNMIIFGGWVGDINTAASPQLAILKIGNGYGGSGNWAWRLPMTTGTGFQAGEGIYGHGAIMLPGNVMMLSGGTIITPTTSKLKRTSNSHTLFLNVTSMSWISSYTNPTYVAKDAGSNSMSAASSAATDYAKKVGLGAGLGIGLAAVVAAVAVYFWYTKRLQKRRDEARQRDIQALSNNDKSRYEIDVGVQVAALDMPYWKDEFGQNTLSPLDSRRLDYSSDYHNLAYDELHVEHPVGTSSPQRLVNFQAAQGSIRPMSISSSSHNRNDYTTRSHHRSSSKNNPGTIHPIFEADEEADITEIEQAPRPEPDRATSGMGMRIGDPSHELFLDHGLTSPFLEHGKTDPFRDPSPQRSGTMDQPPVNGLALHPPNATVSAQEREREVASWIADWTAADALLHSRSITESGRLSPSKESSSGRTRSDLSERSTLSNATIALSRNDSAGRSNSFKAIFTGTGNNWNSYYSGSLRETSTARQSSRSDRYDAYSVPDTCTAQSQAPMMRGSVSQSVQPALSSTDPTLRPESQSLLPSPYIPDGPGSPSKNRARRNMGWLGSIKKALVGEEWVCASDTSSDRANSPTKHEGQRNSSMFNSPTAYMGVHETIDENDNQTQRSTSMSTMLWRRRQGREDWEDSNIQNGTKNFIENSTDSHGENAHQSRNRSADEDDWDVERAVRERVVQVMFTVPKEKLRVVNHNVDDDSSDVGSIAGSVRSKRSMHLLSRKKSTHSFNKVIEDDDFSKTATPRTSAPSLTRPSETNMATEMLKDIKEISRSIDEGERIESKRTVEIIGRSSSPEKRRSKVLDMVEKMEKG